MPVGLAAWVDQFPAALVYLGLGLGAAIENVVPAVPADTFVVVGGFLAALGDLQVGWVFLATWVCNSLSAIGMYRMGHTHGRAFFDRGLGRRLLEPHQMQRMQGFYERWGTWAIFWTRFLPGLRAVVPVFAGVSHQRFWSVALPLTVASAIWYAALVGSGFWAGQNLGAIQSLLGRVNGALGAVALVVTAAVVTWWWRTRHPPGA